MTILRQQVSVAALLLGACVLVACEKKTISSAPACSSVDDLILTLDSVTADTSFWTGIKTNIESLPPDVWERASTRIAAKLQEVRQKLRMSETEKSWVAVSLLSAKTETRASAKFRYCQGEFDLGNGQALRWHYSLATENGSPVLRMLSQELTIVAAIMTKERETSAIVPTAEVAAAKANSSPNTAVDERYCENMYRSPTPADITDEAAQFQLKCPGYDLPIQWQSATEENNSSGTHDAKPSFDCAKAATKAEQLICSDGSLAHLDATMANNYLSTRARVSDKAGLRDAQNKWMREVRDSCSDVACMKGAFRERIAHLQSL